MKKTGTQTAKTGFIKAIRSYFHHRKNMTTSRKKCDNLPEIVEVRRAALSRSPVAVEQHLHTLNTSHILVAS